MVISKRNSYRLLNWELNQGSLWSKPSIRYIKLQLYINGILSPKYKVKDSPNTTNRVSSHHFGQCVGVNTSVFRIRHTGMRLDGNGTKLLGLENGKTRQQISEEKGKNKGHKYCVSVRARFMLRKELLQATARSISSHMPYFPCGKKMFHNWIALSNKTNKQKKKIEAKIKKSHHLFHQVNTTPPPPQGRLDV